MAKRRYNEGSTTYLKSIKLDRSEIENEALFPFCLPIIRNLTTLKLDSPVVIFVGENGTGKSTIIEALAEKVGLNLEGGSKNFNFSTNNESSKLAEHLKLQRSIDREEDAFFLRAESYFNYANQIDRLAQDDVQVLRWYGDRSLHFQSHGESFMALAMNRFFGKGIYILDEPESALSPQRQLELVALIHMMSTRRHSQFIVATHSPIIMAYPDALLYHLSPEGIHEVKFEETEHYQIYRGFMSDPRRYFRHLFDGGC